MKCKRITRKDNYKEWLDLDACDDCGCVNSNLYFKIWTVHNRKQILLCESCTKKILKIK